MNATRIHTNPAERRKFKPADASTATYYPDRRIQPENKGFKNS
jgi:hypothetical protein